MFDTTTCVSHSPKAFNVNTKAQPGNKTGAGVWGSFPPSPPFFLCHLFARPQELVLKSNKACILHPRHPAHHRKKKLSQWTILSRKPLSVHWKTGNASKGLKPF